MAGDTANPRVWINADVFTAPTGSTAPTDTTAGLDVAWEALGLLSEDGATEQRGDTIDDKYAWGSILVRTTRSKHKRTIKVIALEDNPVVFGLLNPGSDAASVSGVTTRNVHVPGPNRVAFILETSDGDIIRRRVIPTGEIMAVADVLMSDSELTKYELDITVYPDADGILYIDITDDPQAVV